jgi:hypothetical protein
MAVAARLREEKNAVIISSGNFPRVASGVAKGLIEDNIVVALSSEKGSDGRERKLS